MRLTTERLILRELVEEDWRAVFAIESIPEVVRYQFNDARDEDGAREYVRGIMVSAREVPRMVFDLAITLHGDDTLLGRVGLKRTDEDPRIAGLWYVLAPAHHGAGYATEAARALIDHAFDELRMHRIYADIDPRNVASGRVLERLEMRKEAHFVQNVWVKGEWCDSGIYAVLAHEWRR